MLRKRLSAYWEEEQTIEGGEDGDQWLGQSFAHSLFWPSDRHPGHVNAEGNMGQFVVEWNADERAHAVSTNNRDTAISLTKLLQGLRKHHLVKSVSIRFARKNGSKGHKIDLDNIRPEP